MAAWQVVDEHHVARLFVAGQILPAVGDELIGSELGTRTGCHDRAHRLGVDVVSHADHRRFEHRRVAHDHILDLDRVDVLSAAFDHVLLPAGDEQRAVLDAPGVAGTAPPTAERLGARLGLAPVLKRGARAADPDLADLARCGNHPILACYPNLVERQRPTHDVPGRVLAAHNVEGGDRAPFSQSVQLQDLDRGQIPRELPHRPLVDIRPAGVEPPERT